MAHQKDTPPDVYTLLKKGGEFSSRYRRSLVLEELTTVADYDILFTGLRLFTALLWCAARQPDDEAKLTAMRAAGQFADLFNDSEDLALPFRRISDALRHGAPVVTQRRRRGRPGLLDEDAILRGYAAATVDRLIATGMLLPDALKSVARELRGARSRRGPVTSRTVRDWREAVQAGVGHHSVAAWVHNNILVGSEGQKFASLETDAAKRACALAALAGFRREHFPAHRKLV